jgi:hypothetical protein
MGRKKINASDESCHPGCASTPEAASGASDGQLNHLVVKSSHVILPLLFVGDGSSPHGTRGAAQRQHCAAEWNPWRAGPLQPL